MIGLTSLISVLSRGQSQPLAVHEACLRAFLRYMMFVDHHEQLFSCNDHVGRELLPMSIVTGRARKIIPDAHCPAV